MNHVSIFQMEVKSYLSNMSAVFWTFAYPIMMLVLLIALFDLSSGPHTIEGYRAKTAVGLIALTLVSTAIFGLGQTLAEMRNRHALLPYFLSPLSLFGVSLSIIMSRVAILAAFSLIYLNVAFVILNVDYNFSLSSFFAMIAVLFASCFFSFSLALGLACTCRNSQTMIAIANILNLYAIMSADVFIPRQILPEWSEVFVTTSPFYYLNQILRMSLESTTDFSTWFAAVGLSVLGLTLIWLFSRRSLFLHRDS